MHRAEQKQIQLEQTSGSQWGGGRGRGETGGDSEAQTCRRKGDSLEGCAVQGGAEPVPYSNFKRSLICDTIESLR